MGTDTVTIAQFIKANRISMTAERTDFNPHMEDSRNMDHWKCVVGMGGKRMTVVFSQGFGHKGKEPKLADVLNCIAFDASSVENSPSFEDWASDLGYETDSRKAEKTFKYVEHQAKRLRKFLGDDLYQTLLWNTERE
ncbi:MAG TPA: hypothetical protein VFI14_01595 [Chryseosolibacter sp.]|nr:hypothetical protein [Chryseosolibacter sp.]